MRGGDRGEGRGRVGAGPRWVGLWGGGGDREMRGGAVGEGRGRGEGPGPGLTFALL